MSIPVARLGNTQVYLHVTFLVAALVLAMSGFALHLLVFAGSLLFHEMGHLVAASLQGAEVARIEVWPFGAVGRLDRAWQLGPAAETTVALAGPLNSGLLCSVAWAVQRGIVQAYGPSGAGQFPVLSLLIRVNLGLLLVNLIPCLPLDGGRVLRSQLALKSGYVEASRKVSRWGLWAGFAITAGAVAGVLTGQAWYPFLVIGPVVAWGATDEKAGAAAQNIMEILNRTEYLAKRKAIPVQEIMVSLDATVSEVVRKLKPSRYHVILVAGKGMKVVGKVTEASVLQAFYEGSTRARMRDIIRAAGPR